MACGAPRTASAARGLPPLHYITLHYITLHYGGKADVRARRRAWAEALTTLVDELCTFDQPRPVV